MVKFLVALIATASAGVPTNWGVQDVWALTSTWYAGHCTCFCRPLCSHPTDFMKTNLVAQNLVPRFNNFSVPSCDEPIELFPSAAIKAVGQVALQNAFPVGYSRNVPDMWSPTVAEGNVPNFGYPCGGLYPESYLRTIVQLTNKLKTPQIVTSNIGKEVKITDLQAAFKKDWGADVVLMCLNGAFTDVISCWTKRSANGEVFPSKIVSCPAGIASWGDCTNATTKILEYSLTVAPTTLVPTTTAVTTFPPTTKAPTTTTKRTTKAPRTTKTPTKVPTTTPKTTKSPVTTAATTTVAPAPTPAPTEIPGEVDIWVKFFQRNARCAIFGEENCSYCEAAKALLKSKKAKYGYFGVWMDNPEHIPSGMDVYYSLVRVTKQDTLPNIWIGGKFIGGSDALNLLNTTGKLDQLLKDAKCT